jgi:hypothetical protein
MCPGWHKAREGIDHLPGGGRRWVFNQICVRETTLGPVLHAGELMTLEPFGNTLTCVQATDPAALVEHLTMARTWPDRTRHRRIYHPTSTL